MEACIVCVDNSEWTRNGDFEPTRFQAQSDAINLLAGAKTGANPENTVGVLTCATTSGKSPKVMVTPTPDLGKVLSVMSQIEIEGSVDICKAAQIAQIALKHRQNKNQRQKVVLFIGSPLSEDKEKLVKVGKKLKKNNVSLDIVSFGDCSEANHEKLDALVAAVNKDNNSHLVEAPLGSNLCDFLLSTAVVGMGGGGETGGGGGAAGAGFEYGVDPNIDPELAMALRISMQEEQARQQAAAAAAARAAAEAYEDKPAAEGEAAAADAAAGGDDGGAPMDVNDDEALQQALAMSMQGVETETPAPVAWAPQAEGAQMDEDPDLALALAMSMTDGNPAAGGTEENVDATPEYLASVLAGLPNVDVNDPSIQAAIQAMAQGNGDEDAAQSKEKEGEKDKDKQ